MDQAKLIEESIRPYDGWWMNDTEDTILWAANRLLEKGFSYEDAEGLLSKVVGTIRGEYGE